MRQVLTLAAALALAACGDGGAEAEPENTGSTVGGAPERTAAESNGEAEPMRSPEGERDTAGAGEFAEGQWFAKTERGVPMALYGPPQTEASFLVRCEGEQLALIRSVPIEDEEAEMTLTAGGETRTLPARQRPGPLAQTAGVLPASDPFAEVLAQTTGPISVRVADGPAFRMPSHEHLRDVAANCRA